MITELERMVETTELLEKILLSLDASSHLQRLRELRLDALDHAYITTEALELVDTHIKVISSVKQIIVEVYEDGPNDQIRRDMEKLGWTAQKTENVEEEDFDRSLSDVDDYSFDYDNDYLKEGDDYDIDNDNVHPRVARHTA